MPDRQYAKVVNVPKTPPGAYNPGRLISSLIQHQVQHFREVEKSLPPEQQTHIDIGEIETEGQAAAYIQQVTARLHARGARRKR